MTYICTDCGMPVSEEEMLKRREELAKMGVIARIIVPMCKACREDAWTHPPVVRRIQ